MTDAETRHTEAMLSHLRAAAEADTEAERDLLLKAAVLRMAPNYLYALYASLMEFAEPCRAMKRRKPEKTARPLGDVPGGRFYAVEPCYPTGDGGASPRLLVSEHDGHLLVAVCDPEGNTHAYMEVVARFPLGTADDAALRGIGYEVTELPTDQSPEPAAQPGIPGIPEFIAERERREAP